MITVNKVLSHDFATFLIRGFLWRENDGDLDSPLRPLDTPQGNYHIIQVFKPGQPRLLIFSEGTREITRKTADFFYFTKP